MFLVNGCSKGDSDLRLPLQDLCEGVAVGEPLIKGWVDFGWGKGRCNHASGQEKDHVSSWGSSLCLLCHSVVSPHLAWGQTRVSWTVVFSASIVQCYSKQVLSLHLWVVNWMLWRLFISLKRVELLCGEEGLVAQLLLCLKILSILDMGAVPSNF